MDQIELGFAQSLILCRIHYALSKIPKLRVKSSICFNINKSIEIITLRHTRTSPIGSEHSQALNESVATRIAKVRRKVIGVYSVFLLDVVFRERGFLVLREEVWVELDPALSEQLIRCKVRPRSQLFPAFVPKVRSTLFPLRGLRSLLLLLGSGCSLYV